MAFVALVNISQVPTVVQRTLGFEAASVVWGAGAAAALEPMDAGVGKARLAGQLTSIGSVGVADFGSGTHASKQLEWTWRDRSLR